MHVEMGYLVSAAYNFCRCCSGNPASGTSSFEHVLHEESPEQSALAFGRVIPWTTARPFLVIFVSTILSFCMDEFEVFLTPLSLTDDLA